MHVWSPIRASGSNKRHRFTVSRCFNGNVFNPHLISEVDLSTFRCTYLHSRILCIYYFSIHKRPKITKDKEAKEGREKTFSLPKENMRASDRSCTVHTKPVLWCIRLQFYKFFFFRKHSTFSGQQVSGQNGFVYCTALLSINLMSSMHTSTFATRQECYCGHVTSIFLFIFACNEVPRALAPRQRFLHIFFFAFFSDTGQCVHNNITICVVLHRVTCSMGNWAHLRFRRKCVPDSKNLSKVRTHVTRKTRCAWCAVRSEERNREFAGAYLV